MSKKKNVCVFAGGRSTEHEVSLASAYNIVNAIDTDTYNIYVIGISQDGVWRQYDSQNFVQNPTAFKAIKLAEPISGRVAITQSSPAFYDVDNGGKELFSVDVIFPAVLGNYSEDGTMQGLLRMMDVPFTTPDVLGSAMAMDKEVMKRLFIEADIPSAKYVLARKNGERPSYAKLVEHLGEVMFIKPANNGSSIGVYKAANKEEFEENLEKAFRYDVKVIIEEAIVGREVEISMMGNIGNQQTSAATGEIIERHDDEFYSYENKYVNSDKVELVAPADVTEEQLSTMQGLAVKACETLECEGFARVDFFVTEAGEIMVNEVNTMPGFTQISMFPRLWQESGVSYPELIGKLLELAVERHEYRIKPIVTNAQEVLESL